VLYGVTTRRLNEQVRRNRKRFPDDFLFALTTEEFANVKSRLKQLEFLRPYWPVKCHGPHEDTYDCCDRCSQAISAIRLEVFLQATT
jgi:ORF6N domain